MPFRSFGRVPGVVLVLAVLVLAPACGKKRAPALATAAPGESGGASSESARAPVQPVQEGPDVRAMQGEGAVGSDISGSAAGSEGSPLADIHFDYDSAALGDDARATLEKHALWLQGHREARVTIEGHCDERGTVEYNLALGEQRARATRDYLASLGVAGDRLRAVSFGKERPLDPGTGEAAWARNRRAHFAVSR
jgi:peptidoglycan-associated lipoprotein